MIGKEGAKPHTRITHKPFKGFFSANTQCYPRLAWFVRFVVGVVRIWCECYPKGSEERWDEARIVYLKQYSGRGMVNGHMSEYEGGGDR